MLKKRWILLLVFSLTLTLSACAVNSPKQSNDQVSKMDGSNTQTNNDTNPDANISKTDKTTNAVYESIKMTPIEIFNLYVTKYPNAKVNQLALGFDLGSYVYEVEGYDGTNKYELKIEPMDGRILMEEQKRRNDNDTKGEITAEQVKKIQELIDKALKDAGNHFRVDEWELKFENGQSIFQIEVVDGNDNDIEYKYNIDTMKLVEKDQ